MSEIKNEIMNETKNVSLIFNEFKKEIEWGGRKLTLETGKIARQADGAVIATYGETSVMCAVVSEKTAKEGIDFLPLTVHYREMAYAAGKIPGGFFKREGRPSEKEILTSRLIDRPIRPLFPQHYHHETQIICTVLSHDLVNDPDIVALIATSAALAISGIPFGGPVGAARVGYQNGEYVLNPFVAEMANSDLDLVVAGTYDSVLMVESEAHELSEEVMLDAVIFGQEQFKPVINLIKELADEAGKERLELIVSHHDELLNQVNMLAESGLREAYKDSHKQSRYKKISDIEKHVIDTLTLEGHTSVLISSLLKKVKQNVVRNNILDSDHRIDGRDSKSIRPIVSEVGLLNKTHGSALFTRGETQALVVTTLGTAQDEQIIDALDGDGREHFMLHYNFPPYSVGEASPFRAPGRREIGHGKLAWRALRSLMPSKSSFPYTIRVVSEITESNGSSSMATVCGASLSMMDAGVPLKRPVAGIAMGLIKEGDRYSVLSDIMGDEDHLGDMDFKVAGTSCGITALQMDIKIAGINSNIMKVALDQAKDGRMHILARMSDSIIEHRSSLNENAPTITTITISKDKIREVIGSGGSVIKKICEVSGAKVDIDDTGVIKVAAVNSKAGDIAIKMIQDIVCEPEIGKVYEGKVVKIVDFGAFVNFMGSRDGLVHISELVAGRVNQVADVINENDNVKVLVVGVDNRGKVKLSMRLVNQETGEVNEDFNPEEASNNSGGEDKGSRAGGKSFRPKTGEKKDRGDRAGSSSGERSERSSERGDRNGNSIGEKRKYFS
jgi:polyribonucleotide nucleotidyltransferase